MAESATLREDQKRSHVVELLEKDKQIEAIFLGNLGLVYFLQGKYKKALQFYQKTIGISMLIKDRRNEAIFLGNRGDALSKLQRNKQCTIRATTPTATEPATANFGPTKYIDSNNK